VPPHCFSSRVWHDVFSAYWLDLLCKDVDLLKCACNGLVSCKRFLRSLTQPFDDFPVPDGLQNGLLCAGIWRTCQQEESVAAFLAHHCCSDRETGGQQSVLLHIPMNICWAMHRLCVAMSNSCRYPCVVHCYEQSMSIHYCLVIIIVLQCTHSSSALMLRCV
jgi:hypothetical protein